MSAYLHRLIARDQAPETALSPFVRSQSPIAEFDQRLAVGEHLGHGFAGLDVGQGLGGEELADEPIAAVSLAPSTPRPAPASSPEPNTTIIQRKATAPNAASPVASSSSSEPAAAASSAHASRPARPLQLDPGPLFDLDPTPRHFEEARIHEIIRESTPTSLAPEPRVVSRPLTESLLIPPFFAETSVTSAPALELPVAPTAFEPAPAPWRPFEPFEPFVPTVTPFAPTVAPFAPTIAPFVEPEGPASTPLAPIPARLEPSPLAHRPIAVHPAESPTTDSVQVQSPRSVQVHIGRVDIEIIPSSSRSPAKAPRKTRIDIESISQIGPLDRHFPNRRRLRLRYR